MHFWVGFVKNEVTVLIVGVNRLFYMLLFLVNVIEDAQNTLYMPA